MHSYKIDTALRKQLRILDSIKVQSAQEAAKPVWTKGKKNVIKIGDQQVRVFQSTRRLIRISYRLKRQLARINRLRQLISDMEANYDNRQQVKTLKAAKRKPCNRIRTKDELAYQKFDGPLYFVNGKKQVTSPRYGDLGVNQAMRDFKPIVYTDIPRNPMIAQKFRSGSLSSSLFVDRPNLRIELPKSKWAVCALSLWSMSSSISTPTIFVDSDGQKALLKATAEMNAATLQLNEYIVEFHQVVRLLKDPVKTVLQFHKTLKSWVGSDAWLMIPNRTIRRFDEGLLVSKAPTGATLMSMRTRKTVDVLTVAKSVRDEAANRWLQYRYGIAPMAADVAVVTGLLLRPKPDFPIKNAQAKVWVTPKSKIISELPYKFNPVDTIFRFTVTSGKFYTAKVWYQLKHEVPSSYKYGLHPRQLANIVWNALPWSFVADWAINIDDWLKAINTPPWVQTLGNVVTAKEFSKVSATLIKANYFVSPYDPVVVTGTPHAVKALEKINRRVNVVYDFDFPSLEDKWMKVKNILTGLCLSLTLPIWSKDPKLKR